MISQQTQKPEIIIVDDNLNFRQGLIFLITIDNVANVIGKASNEKELFKLLSNQNADVILIDISMLLRNEMETMHTLLKLKPDLKIIAFTMFGDEEYYFTLSHMGVTGFLLKSGGINELERAIENVMKGETYVSDQLLKKILINYVRSNQNEIFENSTLTSFEFQLLKYIIEGMTNDAIAEKLVVNSILIKEYKINLLKKISSIYKYADTKKAGATF